MDAGTLLKSFRLKVHDTKAPYLWSDAEFYGYADQAQREFVRLIGGLRDSRSEVTRVSVAAGDEFIPLDPRVIEVVSARNGEGRPVDVISAGHADARATPRVSRLVALVAGEDEGGVRPVGIPELDDTLQLVVKRLPLEKITGAGDEFELRDEHQDALLDGVCSLAYLKQDVETLDKSKASDFKALFEQAAARAFREARRRAGRGGTVAYGGL
ncbi:hypothetical protein [Caldimonas sp. KR1-144]|uniref:phage adaptor protein n=1 Tax=Caldimonas sp. KR1-144 TaxID=3400911 RepID=UPI003C12211E